LKSGEIYFKGDLRMQLKGSHSWFGHFLQMGLGCAVLLLAVQVWAVDPEKEKAADEAWQTAVDATCATPQDEALSNTWKDYAQKYAEFPNAPRALYMAAETLFQQRFYDKASKAFAEFLDRYPHETFSPSALYRRGECAYNQKDYQSALELWQAFLDKYPGNFLTPEALYGRVLCHILRVKWRDASAAIETLTSQYPNYRTEKKVRIPLGLVYFHNQQYAQALQYFQSVEGDMATFYVGRCLENLGKFLPAAASYKDVIVKFPDSIYTLEAAYSKADSYYKGNNYSVAVKEFNSFIKAYPQAQQRFGLLHHAAGPGRPDSAGQLCPLHERRVPAAAEAQPRGGFHLRGGPFPIPQLLCVGQRQVQNGLVHAAGRQVQGSGSDV
jgi:TolA-binding protein